MFALLLFLDIIVLTDTYLSVSELHEMFISWFFLEFLLSNFNLWNHMLLRG